MFYFLKTIYQFVVLFSLINTCVKKMMPETASATQAGLQSVSRLRTKPCSLRHSLARALQHETTVCLFTTWRKRISLLKINNSSATGYFHLLI